MNENQKSMYSEFKDDKLTFIQWLKISRSDDFFTLVFGHEYKCMYIKEKKRLITRFLKD